MTLMKAKSIIDRTLGIPLPQDQRSSSTFKQAVDNLVQELRAPQFQQRLFSEPRDDDMMKFLFTKEKVETYMKGVKDLTFRNTAVHQNRQKET